MEHVIGVCPACHAPIHYRYPCECHGDYRVGDVYEIKDFEYTVLSKQFNRDDNGVTDGCVYLIGVRRFGEIRIMHDVVYDSAFNGCIKRENIYD